MDLKVFIALFGLFLLCYADGQGDYSERWTKIYSQKMLEYQPRWKISDQQPADGDYEVREYEGAYWVSSREPCWDQDKANSMGHVNLYFYLMGFNYQGFYYDLTYPIITRVEKTGMADVDDSEMEKGKPRGGKRNRRPKQCPIKHTAMLYIPADEERDVATAAGPTVDTEYLPERVIYVREYFKNYTSEFCNQQAAELAEDLIQDGVDFDEGDWYCARYVPGVDEAETRYEVWFVGA